jgi:hypothetical protein
MGLEETNFLYKIKTKYVNSVTISLYFFKTW